MRIRVAASVLFVGSLLAVSARADGQRLYPDPFLECEGPAVVLRTPDLSFTEPHRDEITITLPQRRLLEAPPVLKVFGVSLRGYSVKVAHLRQQGETLNDCAYNYDVEKGMFLLASCAAMAGSKPAAVLSDAVTLKVPGLSELSRVSVYARFKAIQTAMGCGGRTPMNGQRFFHRAGGLPERWFAVVDEALVQPGSVGTLASQLVQAAGAEAVYATYTAGPLAFAFKGSAASAQALAQDNRIRFVENQPTFTGSGILTQEGDGTWALDRLDQENKLASAPVDHRFRYPEYDPGSTSRPRVFVLDTQVLRTHESFASVNASFEDPNPSLASCDASNSNRSGFSHGTGVAGMLVGSLSTGQSAPLQAFFVKTLGFAGLVCDRAEGSEVANALQRTLMLSRAGDVVNLSWTAPVPSGMIEMQVNALLSGGRVVVAAAGNEGRAVSAVPANVPGVITVGGVQNDDSRYSQTNFGAEVEVFGPAQQVKGPYDLSMTATSAGYNGTSIASPLVAGLVFHNLGTRSGTWPPTQGRGVATEQAEMLAGEGVSGGIGTDVLPVLRGRPLLKSPSVGFQRLAADFRGQRVMRDRVDGLWRGMGADFSSASYSLGRLSVLQNGFPGLSSSFLPMRRGNEACLALATLGSGIPRVYDQAPTVLVGCYGSRTENGIVLPTSYVGFYSQSGEYKSFEVDSQDAPWKASADSVAFPEAFGGVVGVMRHSGGANLEPDYAALLMFARDGNRPSPIVPLKRVLTPLSNHSIFIEDVAIRCNSNMDLDACTVWATTTQKREDSIFETSIVVYRAKFYYDGVSERVREEPTVVLSKAFESTPLCQAPGVAYGYGARGVGVVADDDGDGFYLIYNHAADGYVDNTCVRIGGTFVVRTDRGEVRRLGEGFFARDVTLSPENRTVILSGELEDRLWGPVTPAMMSLNRNLYPRYVWFPDGTMGPIGRDSQVGDVVLGAGYQGFFVDSDPNLDMSVNWFEP